MRLRTKMMFLALGWILLISGLQACLNVNWAAVLNEYRPLDQRKIIVAYLPVTCQLTCPVTDYISKYSLSGEEFLPRMFQGFPEMKEALISNRVQAAFIVAPMALALKAQGVPIKVVYLGHRYGSAVVVQKDGPIKTFADMRGKTIAIPSRFSDERLLLFRAMKVWGIKPGEIKMVEMAPPDVSGALAAHAIDAFVMGEPFPSQAEWPATAVFFFRHESIGQTICRASWWCGKILLIGDQMLCRYWWTVSHDRVSGLIPASLTVKMLLISLGVSTTTRSLHYYDGR